MKKLRRVGFFRERENGSPNAPSLSEARSDTPHPEEQRIVKYLSDGELYIASPGVTRDVLSTGRRPIGSGSLMTDGEWAWPDDLPYYVATYHAAIPNEFIEHMRSNGWAVPAIAGAEFTELVLEEAGGDVRS